MALQCQISDKAYTALLAQGREYEYIRGVTGRGLGSFMDGLMLTNPEHTHWRDKRPAYVRSSDQEILESGEFVPWDGGESRVLRLISVRPETMDRVLLLADLKGVRAPKGMGYKRNRQMSIFSTWWEAVGLGWLVPDNVPPIRMYRREYKDTTKEWDWLGT